jgi:hypothetical protein
MRIPSDLFRHCDVGRFQRDGEGGIVFVLSTVVTPNPGAGGQWFNVLPAGRYVVELVLTADNVNTSTTRWRLEFGVKWTDDEGQMLRQITMERDVQPLTST